MIPDRRLRATISIAGGKDGDQIVDTVTLENFRMSMDVNIAGGAAMGEMDCRIYGVSLALMNQVTAIGPIKNQFQGKSQIQIEATNDSGGMSTIYTGYVAYAYADLNSAPDAALMIHAVAGMNLSFKAATPISYAKPVSVVTLMADIAKAAGLQFENHGVQAMMPRCYYDQTLLDQLRNIGEDAGINWEISNGILYIWPMTGSLTDPVQNIEVGRNQVGYPMFNSQEIFVKAEFLPFMRIGGKVKVGGSEATGVNGTWVAYQVSHELDSITPNGRWFTTIGATSHPESFGGAQ